MGFFDSMAASWSPSAPGDAVEGEVLQTFEKQQTGGEYDATAKKFVPNDKPKFFKNGQPAMALVVVLKVADETDDDNGQRSVYINRPSRLFSATAEALKNAGRKDVIVGDHMRVEFIGVDPESAQGNAKMYAVQYTANNDTAAATTAKAAPKSESEVTAEAEALLARLAELQAKK